MDLSQQQQLFAVMQLKTTTVLELFAICAQESCSLLTLCGTLNYKIETLFETPNKKEKLQEEKSHKATSQETRVDDMV